MSCFCIASLDLLPSLNVDASLSLSVSAQAAMALYGQISLGMPGVPEPPFALPQFDLTALASITAVAQLRAQAMASLGIDLTADAGVTALARLTATLDARMSAIASLNLNLDAWIQLASVNAVALDLTAIFEACLSASASAAFNVVMVPPSWGGSNLTLISALLTLSAQLDVSLDAEFMASLQVTASAIARAMADVSLDVAAAASLTAGFSAVAQLGASLGVNPLQAGLPAVRARVAANFSAMASLAAQLGFDLSLGVPSLPALPSIPGLSAAVTASLTVQLQAAASISAALSAAASVEMDLSVSAMVAASLSVSLSAALGINVALPAPCGMCDLPAIMAALSAPSLDDPAAPSSPDSNPPPAPANPPAVAASAPDIPPAAAAAPSAASGGPGGGSSGGSSGSSGGGGVPTTVMTAQLMCTMGLAPSALTVLPLNRTTVGKQVAANIMDHKPLVNVMPFGMCISPANPTVAAATAAALGVLTPMPCVPATASPWMPGAPTVLLGKVPILDSTSKCMCTWTGVVSIVFAGQVQTTVP